MAELSREASKLLEQALTLSVAEQEALTESLISNLAGRVNEQVMAAWDEEVKETHRHSGLWQGQDHSVGRGPPAQPRQAAKCPLKQ